VLVEDCDDALDLVHRSWTYIKSLGADIVYLRAIRADAAISPLLAGADSALIGASRAPYLDLASAKDFPTYEQRYLPKKRSRRRSHLRRLKELGSITFEQHTCGPAADELVSLALMLKRTRLTRRGVISRALHDCRLDRFFRDITLDRRRSPNIRVSAVRCNGKAIAVEISFECKGRMFGGIISHNLSFEKQGLGVVLAEYSIRTAHEQGCATYDLLAPADAYKLDWADDSVEVADWAMPLSPAGGLYARAWLGSDRQWVKKAAHGLPPWLGRTLSAIYRWARSGPLPGSTSRMPVKP
jgi:CelD/BcsL family acetyltransferase involved in cellulose biosynthesis